MVKRILTFHNRGVLLFGIFEGHPRAKFQQKGNAIKETPFLCLVVMAISMKKRGAAAADSSNGFESRVQYATVDVINGHTIPYHVQIRSTG